MIKLQGTVLHNGLTNVAVVVVQKYVIDNSFEANKTTTFLQELFPEMPIVLLAQDYRGVPVYYGRMDLVNWLSNIPPENLKWYEYTFA